MDALYELYTVDSQIKALEEQLYSQAIDEETGEVNLDLYQSIKEQLSALGMSRDYLVENVCHLIKNMDSLAGSIKAERQKLADRQKKIEDRAERLRDCVKTMLNGEKYTSATVQVNFRKTKSVECSLEDITDLPNQFIRYGKPELNKTEVKKFIEQGGTVTGCEIVEKLSMSIK